MLLVNYYKNLLKDFDKITRFRLITLGFILIITNLYIPLLTQYKILLELKINNIIIIASSIIAFFSIIRIIGTRFIPFFLKKTKLSVVYKYYVITTILFLNTSFLYYISPKLMIWIDSFIGIFDAIFLQAYSMALTNYMSYFFPKSFTKFQNVRNNIFTESALIGLILNLILGTFFKEIGIIIMVNILGIMYSLYLLKNINIMNKYDFKYLYNYYKSLK